VLIGERTCLPVVEVIRQAGGSAGLAGLLVGEEHAALVVEGLAGMAGDRRADRCGRRCRERFAGCWRRWPAAILWWWSWTTCSGPALLDLVEHLARFTSNAPMLLVGWRGQSCSTTTPAGGLATSRPHRSWSIPWGRTIAASWSATCSATATSHLSCRAASPRRPAATR
jgi:hypothetical protein